MFARLVSPRRLGVIALLACAALGVAAAAAALEIRIGPATGPSVSVSIDESALPVGVPKVAYDLLIRPGTSSGACGSERTVSTFYFVDTPVDLGGSSAPDATVLVVPVPSLPGTNTPTTLQVTIAKLSSASLPARIEAVLTPSSSEPAKRVSLGYDTCATASPRRFVATVQQTATQLKLDATPTSPGSAFALLGSTFTADGVTRVDPMNLRANFTSNVPSSISAVTDFLPNDRYKVHVGIPTSSLVTLDYLKTTGPSTTTARVVLDKLPSAADFTVSGNELTYAVTGTPIARADVNVVKTTVGAFTQRVDAHLEGLPLSGSFVRDGEQHVNFTTPGQITHATVRIAQYTPGTALPTKPTTTNQSFAAETKDGAYDVADIHVQDLKVADVSWADPLNVHVVHRAGPFDLRVFKEPHLLTGAIRNLPGDITLSYASANQALSYRGPVGSVVGDIKLDYLAGAPIVGRADEAHIHVVDMPSGLDTALDPAAKTFTFTATGGAIGRAEALFTNGINIAPRGTGDTLSFYDPAPPAPPTPPPTTDPTGPIVDPPIVVNHAGTANALSLDPGSFGPGGGDPPPVLDESPPTTEPDYAVFIRLSELRSGGAGFGDPVMSANLQHTARPFWLFARTNDTTVLGKIANLPATAAFTFDRSTHTATSTASDKIGSADFTLTQKDPLISESNQLKIHAEQVPSMTVTVSTDGETHVLGDAPATLGKLEITVGYANFTPNTTPPDDNTNATSGSVDNGGIGGVLPPVDESPDPGPPNLVRFVQYFSVPEFQPRVYDVFVRVSALRHAEIVVADKNSVDHGTISFDLNHDQTPLTMYIEQQVIGSNHLTNIRRVNGEVVDLPETVHFTFNPSTRQVTYQGSAPISSVHAHISQDVTPMVGSAKHIDVLLQGVPSGADITLHLDDADQRSVNVDFLGGRLGLLQVFIDDGAHAPDDMLPADRDGLLFKTQPDDYSIFARVTGLKAFSYYTGFDGTYNRLGGQNFGTQAHIERSLGQDLQIEIQDADASKYGGVGRTAIFVDHAHDRIDFAMTDGHKPNGDDFKRDIAYIGAFLDPRPAGTPAPALRFETNKGANRSLLQAELSPLPDIATVCIAASYADCSPHSLNDPDHDISEISFSFFVTAPSHLSMHDCKETSYDGAPPMCQVGIAGPSFSYSADTVDVDLNLDSYFLLSSEEIERYGINDNRVNVDTHDHTVDGSIFKHHITAGAPHITERPLGITLAPGFHAADRLVRIDCSITPYPSCDGEDGSGTIVCPSGTAFVKEAPGGIDLDFAEEICGTE